jgi:hypothetical protein
VKFAVTANEMVPSTMMGLVEIFAAADVNESG